MLFGNRDFQSWLFLFLKQRDCDKFSFLSQSRQLVRVIAHMLQFTPNEHAAVEEAVEWKVSVFVAVQRFDI